MYQNMTDIEIKERDNVINDIISKLKKRQQVALLSYYFSNESHKDIGKKLKITKERSRGLCWQAIWHFRHPENIRKLSEVIDIKNNS